MLSGAIRTPLLTVPRARAFPRAALMSGSASARALSSLPPLVSTQQAQELVDTDARRVRFLDASWYLDKSRNGRKEFEQERIPGAQFFDIEQIADTTSTLPHMLPTG